MPWRRRIIPALLIVLAGGAVALWSATRTQAELSSVEDDVRRLCVAIAGGADVSETLPAERSVRRDVLTLLNGVCRPLTEPAKQLSVEVGVGDVPGFSGALRTEGAVTHHAIIVVGGAPVLGLRLKRGGDPRRTEIVGFWTPQ